MLSNLYLQSPKCSGCCLNFWGVISNKLLYEWVSSGYKCSCDPELSKASECHLSITSHSPKIKRKSVGSHIPESKGRANHRETLVCSAVWHPLGTILEKSSSGLRQSASRAYAHPTTPNPCSVILSSLWQVIRAGQHLPKYISRVLRTGAGASGRKNASWRVTVFSQLTLLKKFLSWDTSSQAQEPCSMPFTPGPDLGNDVVSLIWAGTSEGSITYQEPEKEPAL